ncbi:hypothetical protein COLO4_35842 [Corchorus olitorius]|uniref:Uncharacterized protein n=1 Tax=Corchorus olitorius TaxID=93759 RepID=A0A1R3GCU3_9ROSI|nr:hypothetical protein COLO4_35842 [Corchorus olitorius]
MLFTASSSFECLHLIFDWSLGSPGTLPYPKVQIPKDLFVATCEKGGELATMANSASRSVPTSST